jgi:hypothetical protein
MSTITFELKQEHLTLLKHLRWCIKDNIVSGIADEGDEYAPPFGDNHIYEAMDVILNGKPTDFNPMEQNEIPTYSEEQKAEWDKLYSELPIALDLILYNQNFELGTYKTRYNIRDWKKIK